MNPSNKLPFEARQGLHSPILLQLKQIYEHDWSSKNIDRKNFDAILMAIQNESRVNLPEFLHRIEEAVKPFRKFRKEEPAIDLLLDNIKEQKKNFKAELKLTDSAIKQLKTQMNQRVKFDMNNRIEVDMALKSMQVDAKNMAELLQKRKGLVRGNAYNKTDKNFQLWDGLSKTLAYAGKETNLSMQLFDKAVFMAKHNATDAPGYSFFKKFIFNRIYKLQKAFSLRIPQYQQLPPERLQYGPLPEEKPIRPMQYGKLPPEEEQTSPQNKQYGVLPEKRETTQYASIPSHLQNSKETQSATPKFLSKEESRMQLKDMLQKLYFAMLASVDIDVYLIRGEVQRANMLAGGFENQLQAIGAQLNQLRPSLKHHEIDHLTAGIVGNLKIANRNLQVYQAKIEEQLSVPTPPKITRPLPARPDENSSIQEQRASLQERRADLERRRDELAKRREERLSKKDSTPQPNRSQYQKGPGLFGRSKPAGNQVPPIPKPRTPGKNNN